MSMVYFIVNASAGTVKIGIAKNPVRRLNELQVGSAERLNLRALVPGGKEVELSFHVRFRKHHLRGEWFSLAGALADFVQSLPIAMEEKQVMEIDEKMVGTIHPDTVRDAILRCAITKAELARRANLHANSLATVESEDWSPRWKTLVALCQAIDEIRSERA
jgi:DNA-binding XRE family transcriptional regulator